MGVYGAGTTGVHGFGPDIEMQGDQGPVTVAGVGVHGVAVGKAGRAGRFESARSAQIQLVPHKLDMPFPASERVNPTQLPAAANEGMITGFLPRDGLGGDLVTLMDPLGQCSLWFCVSGDGTSQAKWAQVLLGDAFAGTA
jgi:hypothetical protein